MHRNFIATLSLVTLLLPAVAWSNTITVMKDGTGDYTLLQPAADAAAAGDTLLIGPGRYEEVTDFAFNSGVLRDAHLVVRVDNLTIMGMDRDSVIIGPSVPAIAQGDPVGLVVAENVGTTHIEKLTFEDTWVGAYTLGDFYADDCVAAYCTSGFTTEGPVTIEHCNLHDNEVGARLGNYDGVAVIYYCQIANNSDIGISLIASHEAQILDTHVVGGKVGIQFDNCPGNVENCIIENVQYGGIVLLESGTVVTIADNTLRNNGWHLDISNYATVDAHQNRLLDCTLYGIWIGSPSTVHINSNDLISPQGYLVYLTGHPQYEIKHYDFTNNYWGTTDPAVIADRIWDNNDSITLRALIDFEPFAGEPVPADATSFGGLKAKFQTH